MRIGDWDSSGNVKLDQHHGAVWVTDPDTDYHVRVALWWPPRFFKRLLNRAIAKVRVRQEIVEAAGPSKGPTA